MITPEEPHPIDIVVASYDRTFTYEKLQIAFDAIRVHKRARLITTNPDRYCPTAGGGGEPDAASIVAAIEAATGAVCEANMGKPDVAIAHVALADLDVDPRDCLMVGDRLSTDIQLAFNAGMCSALVLTGDNSLDDVAAATRKPDFILPSVAELIPLTGPTRHLWA
jgi:ribonucleotide monophosphatase NagD (HAD superfamily)